MECDPLDIRPGWHKAGGLCRAVLDGLDAQIVLLDAKGTILDANASWKRSAGTEFAALVDDAGELNYIEACRSRIGDEPALKRLLGGVRGVLGRLRPDFRCEIRRGDAESCTRWFEVAIRPVGEDVFLATHMDITFAKDCDRRILEAGDYERAQMGRELHDGLSQVLGGLTLSLAVLASSLRKHGAPEGDEAGRLVDVARLASAQARELSAGLHGSDVESRGLGAAIGAVLDRLDGRFTVALDCPDGTSDTGAAGILYRVVRDILSVAVRQSSLRALHFKIRRRWNALVMTVSCEGISPSVLATRGLVNRMRGAGARLNPGGATLRCVFPPG